MMNEIRQGEDLIERNEGFDVDILAFKAIHDNSENWFDMLHDAFSLGVLKGYELAKAGK